MREFDLSPLFRAGVGFDHMTRLLDGLAGESATGYPPYNIEKLGEDSYQISMAVAGFDESELDIEVRDNQLRVTGRHADEGDAAPARVFLHRGIAERGFERRFSLAEHIRVTSARMKNGLLHISLVREVPEALKPRSIPITADGGDSAKTIEGRRAA